MGAAILLGLLAPALGGGTSIMAAALLMAGTGLAAMVLPARGIKKGFLPGAALVLLGTLDWALPAWLVALPWRERLVEAGIAVGTRVSPEPWISLRAWLLLMGGLLWAGWCAGQVWSAKGRRGVCEALALGWGCIALVALAGRHGHVPGWPAGTGLGPFANRNQTATLFAMGAFLAVVSGVERFRGERAEKKLLPGLAWLALLGVYTAALAANRSRSGPLLFCGMTIAWVAAVMPQWKRKAETLGVGLAITLLLGTVFLLTGRGVIMRLAGSQLMDFRVKIFSDAMDLIRASPWTGTGLGCFDGIFPLYRVRSILQERVLHPESDWLWLTAESGLPGLVAILGLGGWMGMQAWRGLARREDRPMQLALCVACAGVALHGLVDVPGHRLGTMMPALLLLGMAAGPDREEPRRMARWVVRGVGAVVLALGACEVVMLAVRDPMPLGDGVAILGGLGAEQGMDGRQAEGEASLTEALGWAPLDWRLYVERAEIEGRSGELTDALADFRRARFLEPDYAGLPFDEGVYWLSIAPKFAIEPWAEALKRIAWDGRPELYQAMMSKAYPGHPELHLGLWSLAASNSAMELVYFGWATPEEFAGRMAEVLHDDPALRIFRTEDLRRLFPIWMNKGGAAELAFMLARRPEWLKAGYRTLAEYDAGHGELESALDLMERYLPPPRLPEASTMGHGEASRRFDEDKGDVAAGMALYREAMKAGQDASALETLQAMEGERDCPVYVHYLSAQLLMKEEKNREAWEELEKCGEN